MKAEHQENLVFVEKDINKFTTSLVNAWMIGRKGEWAICLKMSWVCGKC